MVTRKVAGSAKPAARVKPVTRTKTAKAANTATTRPVAPVDQPALAKPLSAEDILKVLRLGKGANSIEIKLSVPLTGHRATIKTVGLDPVEAQPRQAFFFDTPDLALNRAGVVVRARRIQGGDADTVVKLRPVDPATIDPDIRRSAAFKVEVDVMPGGYVCSASFKGVCSGQEVLDVSSGAMPLRKLLSKEQRAFYDAHAPAGVTMDKLVVLGPTFLLKAKHQPKDFDRPITVEMWLYPDGARILEISVKCAPKEFLEAGTGFRSYLADRGVVFTADQAPKTRTALEFYSARLAEEEPAAPGTA